MVFPARRGQGTWVGNVAAVWSSQAFRAPAGQMAVLDGRRTDLHLPLILKQ